ncbi:MAG: OmpA family protein [Proteobacteria bacterium]|nr:OmpA family protein [Pseudomonadota bacterium]
MSTILGKQRDLEINVTNNSGTNEGKLLVEEGHLRFSLDSGTTGGMYVIWDGVDMEAGSDNVNELGLHDVEPNGVDLTQGGRFDSFLLVYQTQQEFRGRVKLFINDTTFLESGELQLIETGTDPETVRIPFRDQSFFNWTATGISENFFANVGALTFQSISVSDLDFTLKHIQTTSSVLVRMITKVCDRIDFNNPQNDVCPDPNRPARPGDKIRYEVEIENPNEIIPSLPVTFTCNDGAPNSNPPPCFPTGISTLIPNTVRQPDPMHPLPSGSTISKGNQPNDTRVEVQIPPVGAAKIVKFTFVGEVPDQLEPGLTSVPMQGSVETCYMNQCPPSLPGIPDLKLPTDDPKVSTSQTTSAPDPSVVELSYCGNGIVEDNEQCDDKNDNELDDCLKTCQLTQRALGGGGCSAASTTGDAGFALLFVFLLWALRRQRGAAASAVIALVFSGVVGDAHAQSTDDTRNFSAERFRLSSDHDGMLDTESGTVIGRWNWEFGFWLGFADDPLALYVEMDDGRERTDKFLSQRIGGAFVGAVGFGRWLQLGVQVPVIVGQNYDFSADSLSPESSAGLGDITVSPKIQLLRTSFIGFDLAVIPAITLPTAMSDSYFGESALIFTPELALSRRFGPASLAANLGYRTRPDSRQILNLELPDELFARIAGGYRFGAESAHPVDLGLSLSLASAAADPFASFNHNYTEALLGSNIKVTGPLNVFAGFGLGLRAGFGTPDWRALGGIRFARRAPAVLPPPSLPCPENQNPPADRPECPVDCGTYPKNPHCPALGCPDNPPANDLDCDGIPTPPWLVPATTGEGPHAEPLVVPEGGLDPATPEPGPGDEYSPGIEKHDYCPGIKGTPENYGCPAPSVAVNECASIEVTPKLHFRTGSEFLDLPSRVPFEELAHVLTEKHSNARVTIEVGGPNANKDLAEKRARALFTALVSKGVNASNLSFISEGAESAAHSGSDDRNDYSVSFSLSCPENAVAPCQTIDLAKKIEFAVNSAVITSRSMEMLRREVMWVLDAHRDVRVRIEGHTSSEGRREYNMSLSQRRAQAVTDYLVDHGIEASRLKAVGYGPKYLLVNPERNDEDRQKNRRIEFRLTAGGSCPVCKKIKVGKIQFEFNSGVIKAKSYPELNQVVRQLEDRIDVHLRIEGHTSSEGSNQYNKRLSRERAASVMKYLIKQGIDKKRLESIGLGEEQLLIQSDDTEEEREKNRRVEFTITKGGECEGDRGDTP